MVGKPLGAMGEVMPSRPMPLAPAELACGPLCGPLSPKGIAGVEPPLIRHPGGGRAPSGHRPCVLDFFNQPFRFGKKSKNEGNEDQRVKLPLKISSACFESIFLLSFT